jgi:acetolactate synthase-1/2/3 large subunit
MAKILTCKIVANFLAEQGVTHVFDVTGGMIAYLEDAISLHPKINCLPCRHEQGCGFAAEGYSRVSGNLGVAMATSGPGATNLITAIGSCYFDSIPSLFITGQVHEEDLRKDDRIRQIGFQETDIVSVIKPITKYAKQVRSPEAVLYELEKAVFLASSGRPGPVLLDIPINIQRTEAGLKKCPRFLGSKEHKALLKNTPAKPKTADIKKLEIMLKSAKAPVLLVGGGIRLSGTTEEVKRFAEKNNLPVVVSLMGLDSFPADHKNFVGFIGSYGNRHANMVFANADLIISVGSRIDVRQTGSPKYFAQNAKVVHVDIDPHSIGANIKPQMGIVSGLKDFFKATAGFKTPSMPAWNKFILGVKKEFTLIPPSGRKVDPNAVVAEISNAASSSAIVSSDVGNHQMWLAQSWQVKQGQRVLFSGGMGSMGFGLPAAIGAYFAKPKAENILICGDGGFQMNIQELETVRHNKIPLKIFLFNNKSLGMVKGFQDQYLNKRYQSTVIGYSFPDFKKIAYAYDLKYMAIIKPAGQKQQIREALNYKGSVLVEVDLDMLTKMEPKIMYGHALDDQYPFLNQAAKARLEKLKEELKS